MSVWESHPYPGIFFLWLQKTKKKEGIMDEEKAMIAHLCTSTSVGDRNNPPTRTVEDVPWCNKD